MKVLILSENTVGTDLYSGNTYRNIGATDVARRLDSRGIENTLIDWFSHWPKDLLQDSIITYLKDSKNPIIALSTPFSNHVTYSIENVLLQVKQELPHVKILLGGNRYFEKGLLNLVDYFFVGRSMEIFEAWLDGEDMSRFATPYPNVFINRNVDVNIEKPVIGYFRDSDFITSKDIVGFELGLGCKFNCSFCSFDLRNTKNPLLQQSEYITQFMEHMNNKYGSEHFYLADDTCNDDTQKLRTLLEVKNNLDFDPKLAGFYRVELFGKQEQQELWEQLKLTGVSFGIETLESSSAKLANKSGNVDKTVDILKKLKQLSPETLISSGIILGLRGESEQSFLNNIKRIADEKLLDALYISVLELGKPNSDVYDDNYVSDMSANPEKYGYTITEEEDYRVSKKLMHWKNEWTDSKSALAIRDKADAYLRSVNFPTGLSSFEYLNFMAHGVVSNVPDMMTYTHHIEKRSLSVANKIRKEYYTKKSEWIKNNHKT